MRKAPRLRAPDGLRARLKADISVPTADLDRAPQTAPLWRRWFPALSFGVLLLGGFIVLAVQMSQFLELRRENESLRAATANLDQLRQENAELQRLRGIAPETARLQNEHEQLVKLRAEVAQLRAQTQELAALRAENQRLQAERVAAAANTGAVAEDDPFAAAKEQAERVSCVNNLKQIGLAARIWANDHGDVLPGDFLTMSNELSTPKILVCPGDKAQQPAKNWSEFNASSASHELLSPGATVTDPQVVYARCLIHNNVLLVDGSVQMIDAKRFRVEKVDGKFKLKVVIPPEESQP